MKELIMKTPIVSVVLRIRSALNRFLYPKDKYFLATRDLRPISSKFGYQRGTPIDRYWIEDFIETNKRYITGSVLEITDPSYTLRYGSNVTKSDVLDIDIKNKKANIHGDLRDLKKVIKDSTYDCIILTHVLGLVDDYQSAIKECRRILKPGGVILYTGSCIGAILGEEVFWRFNPNSVKFIFEKYFKPKSLFIKNYGNALAGQCFLIGMAQEDLTKRELDYVDDRFPCSVGAVVIK